MRRRESLNEQPRRHAGTYWYERLVTGFIYRVKAITEPELDYELRVRAVIDTLFEPLH